MTRISVVDGLTVHFPHRSPEFVEGFEVGCLAMALAAEPARHGADLSPTAAEQATELARGLGYRVIQGPLIGDRQAMTFLRADIRPSLRVVPMRGAAARS